MDTGANTCSKLEGVELGCIPCTSYELRKPEHGMGYAPTYVCTKNKDPKDCPIRKKNEEQK